ncbi:hypothetical protein [Mycolicibacterium confluentis]|uniref:Uncharacterized protein n=1 Tax=Mycolicibacterium confluentis TaxID=28047 RepID=A0A7I7XU54_9MYCO|nr:hypothetical protein [Mycolicibacterium confluentis]MCV7320952.1 hypothetical protein [Mycolicibacterium confluentis]BBZ32644.1 hypothetical protein MCNF_12490 [Mycolicibacterium confluentis]
MTAITSIGHTTARVRGWLLSASIHRTVAAAEKPAHRPRPHRSPSYYESGLMGRERFRL